MARRKTPVTSKGRPIRRLVKRKAENWTLYGDHLGHFGSHMKLFAHNHCREKNFLGRFGSNKTNSKPRYKVTKVRGQKQRQRKSTSPITTNTPLISLPPVKILKVASVPQRSPPRRSARLRKILNSI